MGYDAARFRKGAQNCRELASEARDELARHELRQMAWELDGEADRLDAEEHAPVPR